MQVDTLHAQLRILEQKLKNSEDQYRHFAVDECAMEEESVRVNIMKARSAPQTNARLQRIHQDYKLFMKTKKRCMLAADSNSRSRAKTATRAARVTRY